MRFIFNLFNSLFKANFSLYKPIYFAYKNISDRKAIRRIKESVREGDTVIDVGANVGFYTLLFSDLVGPTGHVYAFEPDALNFKHLQRLTRQRSNIHFYNKAVGAEDGTIKLYKSKDLNVDHQTYDIGEERSEVVEVEVVAIDNIPEIAVPINFLKVDIQGFDYYAVRGMQRKLRNSPNLRAFGEFWPYGLKKAGTSATAYLDLLKTIGLKVEIIGIKNEEYKSYEDEKLFYTDFIGFMEKKRTVSEVTM